MDVIDTPALRDHLKAGGPWAAECGARVKRYRMRMDVSPTWLAAVVGVSLQTISEVEAGRLVPRDYLRSAIAFALGQDTETIWPPLTRQRVGEIGQVA